MFRAPPHLVPELAGRPSLTRSQCWLIALAMPGIAGPAWCYSMGWIPARLGTLTGLILVLLLGVSTVTDVLRRKIYNWATYTGLGWAILINAIAEAGDRGVVGIRNSLWGAAACGAIVLVAYTLAHGGAGDVKLATGIGALLGVDQGVLAVSASYLLAGGAVLLWTVWTTGVWTFLQALSRKIGSALFPLRITPPSSADQVLLNKPIPLAPYFACGTFAVVIWF